MKKQSLLYGFIFLAASTIIQQSKAMDWVGHLAASGFNVTMQALDYVIPMALPAYLVFQDRQDFVAKARPVEPKTQKFVREQLLAGYPELQGADIEVVKIPQSHFAATNYNNKSYISIPEHLTDAELHQAQALENQDAQRFSEIELTQKSALNKLPVAVFIANAKQAGFAIDASTLALWKGTLLHEGSHLLHKDARTRIAILGTSVLVALYTTEKLKSYFDIHTLASDPTIVDTVLHGLAHIPSLLGKIGITAVCNAAWTYWQEYRADQDSIKRTRDPEILKARSEYFNALSEHDHSPAQVVTDIMDPHPSHTTRAKYFARAAQQLETKCIAHYFLAL
ncbi:MAG: hypothetical protein AB7F19_06660 [Candidatus Babeliales bacterium]